MPPTIVVAHRGGAGLWPENTLAAFTNAAAHGWVVETDVRVTSDGVAVCFHDARIDRVTAGTGRVAASTARDLAALRVRGTHRIPTLGRVLAELPRARFVLDVKDPGAVPAVARAILDHDAAGRVCVTGCWDAPLAELRRRVGRALSVGLGWRALSALLAGGPVGAPPRAERPAAWWAFAPARLLSGGRVARAHRLGLQVAAWTVNDPGRIAAVRQLGVDAVISDRPDLVAAAVTAGRGSGPAPGRPAPTGVGQPISAAGLFHPGTS